MNICAHVCTPVVSRRQPGVLLHNTEPPWLKGRLPHVPRPVPLHPAGENTNLVTFLLNINGPSCLLPTELERWCWDKHSRTTEQNSCPGPFKVRGEMGSLLDQSALSGHMKSYRINVCLCSGPQAGAPQGSSHSITAARRLHPSRVLAACQP